jgi:hypothetical protein
VGLAPVRGRLRRSLSNSIAVVPFAPDIVPRAACRPAKAAQYEAPVRTASMSASGTRPRRCPRRHDPTRLTGLVLVVFAAVYLGRAIGRWPGLQVDRTGIALLGAIRALRHRRPRWRSRARRDRLPDSGRAVRADDPVRAVRRLRVLRLVLGADRDRRPAARRAACDHGRRRRNPLRGAGQ